MKKLLVAALATLAMSGAQAANYVVLNTSTLNDIRKVGGQNIPEIAQYSSCVAPQVCSGPLNPQDPASWPLLDRTLTTYPYADPNNPGAPVAIELNNINVYGTIAVASGAVSGATIYQLGNLSYGTYQSATVISDVVTGDPSVNGCARQLNVSGNCDPANSLGPLNPLVWTYNPVTNQLNHQAGGGSIATSSNVATCVNAVGTQVGGQCRQLRAAIDADGELGGTTIANSMWNWNGMAANYIVRDSTSTPWHAATGTSSSGGLQISGAAGQPGVVWDFSGFSEGYGGVITARVVADVLTGNSATGMSGLYTLYVANAPVPAAAWLLGSAVGLLGWLRRRASRIA